MYKNGKIRYKVLFHYTSVEYGFDTYKELIEFLEEDKKENDYEQKYITRNYWSEKAYEFIGDYEIEKLGFIYNKSGKNV